jgi:xylulokinase
MYLIGYDIGSSSIKAALVEVQNGSVVGSAQYPDAEMEIQSPRPGWAEQDPEMWWENVCRVTEKLSAQTGVPPAGIKAIGIAYQMHGLVAVDENQRALRPSIIWCDSRAVEIGDQAFQALGPERCLGSLLNSPGNFTASKLKWVKEHEKHIYDRIDRIMLPGDYIAMRMTGQARTTISGLSEGIMWDFRQNKIAEELIEHFGFRPELIPELTPTFGFQGELSEDAARELGLAAGTAVTYRAGDQPNNALSLNVLEPGEVAATAGTSGVVYGVSDEVRYDPQSRVNTFAHVNHRPDHTRLGILLCINGTGILNAWLRRQVGSGALSYEQMNEEAAAVPPGSEGLTVLPFGNGAERVLGNLDPGAQIADLQFNLHHRGHLFRAAQEGIAFSFRYGMDIMAEMGLRPAVIRAGRANMFFSPVFCRTLATITGTTIELFDTDGAIGAARGAGIGAGYFSFSEAFSSLQRLETIEPAARKEEPLQVAYERWKKYLRRGME